MAFLERNSMEAEQIAAIITRSNKTREQAKEVDLDALDKPTPQEPNHISKTEAILARYPEPAQETDAEREYRLMQIEYERGPSIERNKALAKSINELAEHNFTNKVLAAACDFTEMADHYPRAPFIATFGPLIEEELKATHEKPYKKPSLRLASFATTYFWKEANWARLISAIPPATTQWELTEFFAQPLHSAPGKRIIDMLPGRITNTIIHAAKKENSDIRLDFRQESSYISLDEHEKLIASVQKHAKQNFTNRILTSTSSFAVLSNPFTKTPVLRGFERGLEQELREHPDKPSQKLVTLITEKPLGDEDIQTIITGVTTKTTKKELSEFLGTRERWSTGLRMIDYLNPNVVMEMTRFLSEKDRVDIWSIKPEMVYDFNAGETLRKFQPESQKKILDTIPDPRKRKKIEDDMKRQLIGLHVSIGLMGGGNIDPKTIDIYGKFATVRKRRICSHADNRKFFSTHEHFRSAY